MIFVEFMNNHSAAVFRMLNPHTQGTTNNRDGILLTRMLYITTCVATMKLLPIYSNPPILTGIK